MRLRDAVVCFDAAGGVAVGQYPFRVASFAFDQPSMERDLWETKSETEQLVLLFSWFVQMTVDLGISAKVVHSALLEIDEYRELGPG